MNQDSTNPCLVCAKAEGQTCGGICGWSGNCAESIRFLRQCTGKYSLLSITWSNSLLQRSILSSIWELIGYLVPECKTVQNRNCVFPFSMREGSITSVHMMGQLMVLLGVLLRWDILMNMTMITMMCLIRLMLMDKWWKLLAIVSRWLPWTCMEGKDFGNKFIDKILQIWGAAWVDWWMRMEYA